MKSQFRSILKLEVFHSYYQDRKCIDLDFFPTRPTRELFNRYGFVFRPFGHGFLLLTDSEDYPALAQYIDQVSGSPLFEINAMTADTNFSLYTSYPINQLGYYSYNTSQIIDEGGEGTVLDAVFQETSTTERQLQIRINPNLLTNDETTLSIELEARQSRWEYLVINQSQQTFGDLQIVSKGNDDITFVNQGETQLPNGAVATRFTSKATDLLTTNYTRYKLDLVQLKATQTRKNTTTIYNGLPVPRPENLTISGNDPAMISSLMYVYV